MSSKIFNISLPTEIVQKTDRLAKAQFKTRSEVIKDALRTYIQDAYSLEDLMTYGREQAKEAHITSEDQIFEMVS